MRPRAGAGSTGRAPMMRWLAGAGEPAQQGGTVPRSSNGHAGPPGERLSTRELDMLGLDVEGLTNKEIATRLYLSPDTVKNHVVRIIQEPGVGDRTRAPLG